MLPVNIRALQHFLYCPHRWGLIELDRKWADNAFVAHAEVIHNRVHSGEHRISTKDSLVLSDVTVYHDELDLYGMVDCMEFHKSAEGLALPGKSGNYQICIVEYKPTAGKGIGVRAEDALQVYAQKVCTDNSFGGNCNAYLYYSDTRKRVKLPFETEADTFSHLLQDTLAQMRAFLEAEEIPPARYGPKCHGCSLREFCLPDIRADKIQNVVMAQGGVP